MSEKKLVLANKVNMIDFMFQWIQGHANRFGERILIIQKGIGLAHKDDKWMIDFWGLDKSGRLVIIECHIDKKVEVDQWVMLNPRMLMPRLSKDQVRDIFQKHLDKLKIEKPAERVMESFFGTTYEELTIGDTSNYRLFLVSSKFSVDTMARVTWQSTEGKEIKLFTSKFSKKGQEAYLTLKQYFPAAKTNRYDVGQDAFSDVSRKDLKDNNRRYLFWIGLLNKINYKSKVFSNPYIDIHRPIIGDKFLNDRMHLSIFAYEKVSGIQLVFLPGKDNKDEVLYKNFASVKEKLQALFGGQLLFDKDKNEVYSISYRTNITMGDGLEWDDLQDKLAMKAYAFENAIEQIYRQLYKKH